ncbi:MAG: hypothetical protein ACOZCL_02250 [Bacillota bacterium]
MHCNNPYHYTKMPAHTNDTKQDLPQNQMYMPQQQYYQQPPAMMGVPYTGVQPPPTSITGMTGLPPVELPIGTTATGLPIAAVPLTSGAGPVDFGQLVQTPVMDIDYTQGYLQTQIGKRVKVEFLIGTNMLIDREGTLMDVGVSYIIIQEVDTDDLLLCDIYSIKFVRFYY